jgi:[glutamine synthetase] adenylyltransferase / [glutamine synthetase]-adenylyl-L-tyrosine phosphorylase
MTGKPHSIFAQRIGAAPVGGSPGQAAFSDFEKKIAHPELRTLLDNPKIEGLLRGVFEGSPYLSGLIQRDAERLERILASVPEDLFAARTADFHTMIAEAADDAGAKRVLRHYKNDVALLTALADLGGVWPVMTVTRVLSETADAVVQAAVRYLFRMASSKGLWRAADSVNPEKGSGYFVLAMGKLGAFELNYSSDIDLIVFFDRALARVQGDKDVQSFFVRLTRDLVVLLEERTRDGYVFRTDLRLRPDAGATQVALSTAAAHGYYETVGQNWERAAMIKARCCAGDFAAGETFLAELAPFIWRKSLDYAAIADVHAMKRQIHAHKGIGGISVLGQNIKLGRGGIREIEFFVQTQQIIAGGRQPDLRVRATLAALRALEARGWVKAGVRTELEGAYKFLRQLEHRLQMVNDDQTHDMPGDAAGLERIARFSGYENIAAFSDDLVRALETVERHYAGLFEDAPELTRAGSNMVFAGATDDPRTVEALARLGYSQPSQVLAIVRGWHHGRTPAVRSAQARERLTEVQPLLIAALADTVDPDSAIASFDNFLAELPAGVQLFSLLKANPSLMQLIAAIMGSAPRLARILSKRRRLLDAVLDPRLLGAEIGAQDLDDLLEREFNLARAKRPDDPMQDILDAARVIGSEQAFLVGVRVLAGSISAASAGQTYALVAEQLIAALLAEVTRSFEQEHGKLASGQVAVVAMGKLGGREMTASSDIDLILIYDCDAGDVQSDGRKPLATSHYYARLTQRLITALSAQTAEGGLYDVDMRLRPSGQKGPVATRVSSFIDYQNNEAWTWEHLALTRARVIAGDAKLRDKVSAAIRAILTKPRQRGVIAADVLDMRQRIATEKGTADIWDLKQVRGGLVDLEFIAQYLQLVEASEHPEVLDQNTLSAFTKLAAAGILDRMLSATLIEAGALLHTLTQILRLSLDHGFRPETAPGGLKQLLVRAAGVETFDALESALEQRLNAVRAAFTTLIP